MSPSSIRRTFNKTSMLFVSTFSDTKKCQCTLDVSTSVSSPDKSRHQQFASCQVKTVLGTSVRCVQHCCGSLSRTRNSCAADPQHSNYKWCLHSLLLPTTWVKVGCTKFTKGRHSDHNPTMSTTAFVFTNSTKYQHQAPVAWGTHKYTHSNPIYLGEKDGYLIYSLIINKPLRTVGNR